MPNPVWIRKYLTDRGYADKDIGFDNTRNQVTLQGKDFYNAAPGADNRTYAEMGDLDKAMNSYDTGQNRAKLKPLADAMVQKAQAAPTPFQAAPTFQQAPVFQAPPQPKSYTPPPAYGGFNAESNAAYQAALRRAGSNAQTATGNAMAELNKRGILNSTITGDRAAQIQQGEFGRVSDTILPQLMQQDYGQYRDSVGDSRYADTTNYNREQDFFKNTNDVNQSNFNNRFSVDKENYSNKFNVDKANYGLSQDQMSSLNSVAQFLSRQGQQGFENKRLETQDARQLQQDHLALADKLSQEYGIQVDPKDNPALVYEQVKGLTPLALQEFKQKMAIERAGITGEFEGKPTYNAKQDAISNSLAAQRSKNSSRGTSISQTKYNADQEAKGFEGEVANELSQFDNEADMAEWLNLNRGEITAQLGTVGFDRIKKSGLSSFQSGSKTAEAASKQESNIRKDAIALAKNDPDWFDEATRESLIQEYITVLKGK